MHQREAQLKEAKDQVTKLSQENRQLLDRWMEMKQNEANRLNEANEFVETTLKTKSHQKFNFSKAAIEETSLLNIKASFSPRLVDKRWPVPDQEMTSLQTSPDGKTMAVAGGDKRVHLWNLASGTTTTLSGPVQGILSIAFNQIGDLILGTSYDRSTQIWDVESRRVKVHGLM